MLSTNLRNIRTAHGLSQNELAVKAGMQQSVISGLERGETKNPRIRTLLAIAKALECSIYDIIPDAYE